MKKKFFITLTAVVLLGVGVGAFLYANSQKTTFSPTTLSPEKERVFEFIPNDARYDPEQHQCTAYAWLVVGNGDPFDPSSNAGEEFYMITSTANVPEGDANYTAILVEVLEGELTDCVECQYRCSAYYALCDKYNVTPEDRPTP